MGIMADFSEIIIIINLEQRGQRSMLLEITDIKDSFHDFWHNLLRLHRVCMMELSGNFRSCDYKCSCTSLTKLSMHIYKRRVLA